MNKKSIIDAYIRIRKIDHSIPDEVLDFMKESALEAINHPEIKSLFEKEVESELITACYGQCSDCSAIFQSEECGEMQELRNDEIRKAEPVEVSEIKSYSECDTIHFGVCVTCRGTVQPDTHKLKCSCGQKLIWPKDESSCKEIVDNSIEGYDVKDELKDFRCDIMYCLINSPKCQKCDHFQGHESHSSIRCAFEVNNGG